MVLIATLAYANGFALMGDDLQVPDNVQVHDEAKSGT